MDKSIRAVNNLCMLSHALRGAAGHRVIIVGAGIGGLAAACRLAAAGAQVTVLERQATPGGKMRTIPSLAGPVDAGPTVLTLPSVISDLFAAMGERLEDHIHLHRQARLARHFWPDGSQLDLWEDMEANLEAIRTFSGNRSAQQFQAFSSRAKELFFAFDAPMMQASRPTPTSLAIHCLRNPEILRQMAPFSTFDSLLNDSFDDARLRQLFGRYATYVGGSPYKVPALLALIWQAERSGVWTVEGGMHQLAIALAKLAETRGVQFAFDTHVSEICTAAGAVTCVQTHDGTMLPADCVFFNGDPRALATGALGEDVRKVAAKTRTTARSLSAEVWAFAARKTGPDLALHNVFFRADPKPEFDALEHGGYVDNPTLYICAMDRGGPAPPPDVERFEIIANAPPLPTSQPELSRCRNRTFQTLEQFGLRFDPTPDPATLTTPTGFNRLFPASQGALYGQSPHGTMAAFSRPTARTKIRGLYLAGGGTHPGAGVPMAILSARHAVEAILKDQISTSTSRRTDMPGGISTGSATTDPARSASSRS